jgi:hypothetical protein
LTDDYVLRLVEPCEQAADWVAPPVTLTTKAGEAKRDVRIELSKGGMVEIAVTDACEPAPIPRAVVRVRGLSDRKTHQSVTRDDGVAQIRLAPGDYEFEDLTKRGYTYAPRKETFPVEEGQMRRLARTLRRLSVIGGTVHDEAGRPLAGTAVRIYPMGEEEVLSDAQGRFRVTWDPYGWPPKAMNYLIALDRQRHLAVIEPTVKDRNQIELTLRPTATFVGQVIDINDRGIPGAEVAVMLCGPTWGSRLFRNDIFKTDAQGRFEIHTIPPEQKYHITVIADGYGRTDVDVEKGGAVIGRVEVGTLHLAMANLAVSGVVVDPQGRPVPDAGVHTIGGPSDGQRDRKTRTDREGRFRLEGLCAGLVRLQASAQIEGAALYANLNTDGGAADVRIVLGKSN